MHGLRTRRRAGRRIIAVYPQGRSTGQLAVEIIVVPQ
jgi:hypothetical protein